MKSLVRPIASNETSYNVVLLHKALEVLGLPVSKKEVDRNRAGPDTRKKVRALQKQLNVAADESGLVNNATIVAIEEALDRRRLTAASRSFTVTGTVRLQDGSAKKQQRLLAFDLDLRGVAVYRTVKTTTEIDKNGGFEFLGQAVSDGRGNYSLTFYDWQYLRAERKKADVVVYAVEEGEGSARIVGHSRVINSDDYSDKGLVKGLDITIAQTDGRTEYEVLMSILTAFLQESEVALGEIALVDEQLAFTAGELDLDLARLTIAAAAELLAQKKGKPLLHELLYGLGRQNIRLSWSVLYKESEEELRAAIAKSVDERIIRASSEKEVTAFLRALLASAAKEVLDDTNANTKDTLNAMLSSALPKETQRVTFLNALGGFKGTDFSEFWSKHLPAQPEFKDNPQLISNLLFTQQLTLVAGNHQALVKELQVNRKVTSMNQLVALEKSNWLEIIKKTGVPDFILGNSEEERAEAYADQIQTLLNAAFPTRRIASMVEKSQLPIEKTRVSKAISGFLSVNANFDFASSRIYEFDKQIKAAAGDDFDEVKNELMRIQRVFQVSTTPEAMIGLMDNNLNSAYSIAGIPRKSFIKTYADAVGGEPAAFAIHQRASHIATKSELAAMHMMEYSRGDAPEYAMGPSQQAEAMAALQKEVPNYTELFGSPDLCECEHCRSVYSAAAYFVDLLRFLWRGQPNPDGKTPLDLLKARRPDLVYLPLTCENTNTIIPYIDLANEVMEYYTTNDSLASFKGYDTGEATADELRANPQNFNLEAYRKIKSAKYPFTLPYHQPLDVIRIYSDHLTVSRYDALTVMNPAPDATTAKAIAAESLRISDEEYTILTDEAFDGTADTTPLHEYFGYTAAGQLENLSAVPEFLRRSGVAYTDLVELVKTRFINPFQSTLAFLGRILAYATIDAAAIYAKLTKIEAGTLDPATDADIMATLNAYNTAQGTSITASDFGQWVVNHLGEFQQVITLHEPDSKCDLETTKLWTIQSIYEGSTTSGISNDTWSKMHRFIRLWREVGWTVHEIDLMLAALGDADITNDTINKLQSVLLLSADTKQPLNQLAVLWGNIDTYGNASLYGKLFLNKAVQQIDEAFKADAWGSYLQNSTEVLADHQSAMLAAFRIREGDLAAILGVAEVVDRGAARPIDMTKDVLNLANLSTLYRHIVLAKALKMRVTDLCMLITLFSGPPFSIWDIQQEQFTNVAPGNTYDFYKLADSTKRAGFKTSILEYVLQGTLPAESAIGLDPSKTLQVAKAIRDAFSVIELNHPETPPSPLTLEIITAKLALTFQPEIVSRFSGILDGSASFETVTDKNLNVTVPDGLSGKYSYENGSGRLTCVGVMTGTEQLTLNGLTNAPNFKSAVAELYAAPETLVSINFNGIFSNLADANAMLLDHPARVPPATLEGKLAYVYSLFIPILKSKLQRDVITQHIAALIRLSDEATALLIASNIGALITDLSTKGFSATYFKDATWTTAALQRTDGTVDFDWGIGAPDASLPADNFSVRWETYVAAPASGEYTFVVDVEEADELFKLYLDDTLILEKTAADANISWEVVAALNAAQMYLLRLEYAEITQNAGAHLRWKTATTAPEVVPASVAYPAAILDAFAARATVLNRAAKFVSGFQISETELNHLIAFKEDFNNIDFTALTADHWIRVRDYTTLRNAVPQAQALLTDVFVLANTLNPAPTVADLREVLYRATAWDKANLEYLVDTRFALSVDDFKNEIALNRLRDVMQIVAKTGMSAQTIANWGTAETDFAKLADTAQRIKNAVKAKYEEGDWLDVAGHLSDKIRERQKQALIGYLLTRPAIQTWGAQDADSLFEYFLIDVQMGACMDTSRIVQANSSVQMFVNRCLLNLESDTSSGSEKGVSPGAIDKDRWEWMKHYRLWEDNRQVFLYPENWLEPEWRRDRSEFFKDLESYLVQNDITERSVEQAFRNYLAHLNVVANLEVCGIHQEYQDGKAKYLHVFARTHNAPYKFFYRRWNEYQKWSTWERVALDIRSVENGADSGVHLIPVVWKKRLILFWPEFNEVQKSLAPTDQSAKQLGEDNTIALLEPNKHWEIRLAWSEYVDGRWTPKQVSKESATKYPDAYDISLSLEKDFLFTAAIPAKQSTTQQLRINITDADAYRAELIPGFTLQDIQSPVDADNENGPLGLKASGTYSYLFDKRKGTGVLKLMDDVYLQTATEHKLLPVDTMTGLDITLDTPLFFSDAQRTYFVRPVEIYVILKLRSPANYMLYIPGRVKNGTYQIPPPIGPDDSIPVAGAMREFNRHLMSKRYGMEVAQIASAFGGDTSTAPVISDVLARTLDTGLEFHTFYHPFSGAYVTNLNEGGLPGLMESDTAISSDDGATFEGAYNPYFTQGYVQKPSDFADHTYYKENICFDPKGANSLYNWELFFHAPLYIATRLSRNGKFQEAMKWFHYIFDPTTDQMPGPGESEESRYWKVLPFKTLPPGKSLEDWFRTLSPNTDPINPENAIVGEWRDNPFDPHLIAANRPLAYMKHVVVKYVQNLIAWGDFLFSQDTMESVNEALQIYVIANHILGPRAGFVPKRGEVKAESYESLKDKWDDFSNALVALENLFPYSSEASVSNSSSGPSLLGVGSALYFCIPPNDKLLEYWDTVADRLFKIRHCQNIDGVERRLALFAPPIDPAALIRATSQGLSLGSILADLSSPPPIHRFSFLIEKANEFCGDVKALGTALLAALEKKDAEELGRLRASHETQMLELMTAVRERQVLDARANRENFEKARETASFRLQHYIDLLGNDSVAVPAAPTISATLSADSQLPSDTAIATVETDVDVSLVDSQERGVKLIPREASQMRSTDQASADLQSNFSAEVFAGFMGLIPQFTGALEPIGVGAATGFGGRQLSWFAGSMAKGFATSSQQNSLAAAKSATMASYIRREQDWTLQANLAEKEIIQLDKQITSADIRIQVAEKELANHTQQIENTKAVELFLKDKFTNQELYQWMKEQLFAVYRQSYNLAYDMAKKAEKACQYETGTETASFIQYGYWDNSKQGLVGGENLQLALRQLEQCYLEEDRRELELTKSVSLARLDPLALIELRETGKCYLSIPEELFDLDFRGHYFRRIKAVRLSIPAVVGPYTSISCSLRMLNNSIRINTSMNSDGDYEHENDNGLLIDDDRFHTNHAPVTAIATSLAQNDSGMFEFNFNDRRYLPFERAGAISKWQVEMSTDKELRQFDYSTISDVILHLDYTARDDAGLFKDKAAIYVKDFLMNTADAAEQPIVQMFSMKHEFPTEWYRFLHPDTEGAEQILNFTVGKDRLPFVVHDRNIVVETIDVFAKCTKTLSYDMFMSYVNLTGDMVTSTEISMPQSDAYGGLNKKTIDVNDAGLSLDELDIAKPMSVKVKRSTASDYTSLATEPDEIEDMFLVFHYKLSLT